MTAKEKAKEMIESFMNMNMDIKQYPVIHYPTAKQCALIAVAEIFDYLTTSSDVQVSMFAIEYWQQVEQEIEKL